MPVAVVTDSTADLPPGLAHSRGITVVPLAVILDGVERTEGQDISPDEVAAALAARAGSVSTSRPSPDRFAQEYRGLLEGGATGIVSVHLSARLSGTFGSAELAAAEFGDAVQVVDSRSTGMGLGFAALAAAAAAAEGQDLFAVRDAAVRAAERTDTYFYVDTLDYLRRGGRIGAASAMLGTALSVKPILHVVDGVIVVREKVRTAGRALARLVDIAVAGAEPADVDIAVHHLAAPDRAAQLADGIAARLGDRLHDRYVLQIGAAIGAHVGPGMTSIVVHRHPD